MQIPVETSLPDGLLDSTTKEALRKTIRRLRAQLIDELTEATRGEYHLDVSIDKAKLPQARDARRHRLDAWLDEQVRANGAGKTKTAATTLRSRYLEQAIKEAAHTLLNRLVLLRILEHHGLVSPPVVIGGFRSPAYEKEYLHYAGPLADDSTRGYQALLEAVFAELALELPGLYGPVGLTPLFPIPPATLREVIEALNDPALDRAWGDDTTLGWVYQYWNDPEREALDAKIAGGGKIEPHEIAHKTQMFTERYMVEWLLQNSLGLTWLCICKRNQWKPDADAVLPLLDERRAEWRKRREAGEIPLDALMPIAPGLEDAWKYYVPQPIPEDAVAKAPESITRLTLLDPACGSGHFLVIAFDLLARMYREEAKHRGEAWSDADIAESILRDNLHGIDIDPRAIQIAAASLWLKAKLFAPDAKLSIMNLVAPVLRLGRLPDDDPALAALKDELETEVKIPKDLTDKLVRALAGVDYLGSLFRVDAAIRDAIGEALRGYAAEGQGQLFGALIEESKDTVLAKLESFLSHHASGEDLGIRLDGEQLAAGVRFVRLAREGHYDIVVGNPPYQGLSKVSQFEYVAKEYPMGKADLYAAFLLRALELVREGGLSALLTMRGWMFLGQFESLRKHLIHNRDLSILGDLDRGAFEDVPDEVLATAMSIFRSAPCRDRSIAMQPTPLEDRSRDGGRTARKRAAVLAQVGRYEFDPKAFNVIDGEPIVYWWTTDELSWYQRTPKLSEQAVVREGLGTRNDARYVRFTFEVHRRAINRPPFGEYTPVPSRPWVPFVKGAEGRAWFEPPLNIVNWSNNGVQLGTNPKSKFGRGADYYFRQGIAYSTIGAGFTARAHWTAGIYSDAGSSLFAASADNVLCCLNGRRARWVLESLNPTVNFTNDDVERVPLQVVEDAAQIVANLRAVFQLHEAHREASLDFTNPGPSSWNFAQSWAQRAVDRPDGAPLPPYEPKYAFPAPEAFVSFAIGIALGRFGANGEGIHHEAPADALPAGSFFVGPGGRLPDSLEHPAAARILAAWDEHHAAILTGKKQSLRDWVRKDFFGYHKGIYENRPIYFPLSSERKSFVAWVSIHRWADNTLQTLLADHVQPILRQLDGEIADLNTARASSDKKTASAAEKQYAKQKRLRDELADFAETLSQCAERGAPPTGPGCPPRAADTPFVMHLDDGVMINSAALWPLLAPQWNDPKKWWKQLCLAEGKKDYDWSHLARRYFPDRVEEKCKDDPSLAVAHACFWKYHPAKAHAWELRLQDEIRPDFTIDEPDSDSHRERFLTDHPDEARAIETAERKRRERKAAKTG